MTGFQWASVFVGMLFLFLGFGNMVSTGSNICTSPQATESLTPQSPNYWCKLLAHSKYLRWWVTVAPHQIGKKCCLFRNCLVVAGRMLFFTAEQVSVRMWKCGRCLMQVGGCTVQGGRRPRGRDRFASLHFSCLAINYELYVTTQI